MSLTTTTITTPVQTTTMRAPIPKPTIVFGTASFGSPTIAQAKFTSPTTALPLFAALRAHSTTHLDTARAYPVGAPGTSEALLGSLQAATWATIDTKVTSWAPHSHSAGSISASITSSLAALGTARVRIMYLHAPDRATPFEETCRAMDAAHREGKFERFGLSNYTAEEVEQIVQICEREGLVRPSAYQGQYNAITRGAEGALLDVLRKHGIGFFAYSPTAAGFFGGKITRDSVKVKGSRWDDDTVLGKAYQRDYFKDSLFDAAAKVHQAAADLGLDGHVAALRWAVYHSMLKEEHGDAVIIGASSLAQLESNLVAIDQGPLPAELVKLIDDVWTVAQKESASYHV